jgi:hypothetical protein
LRICGSLNMSNTEEFGLLGEADLAYFGEMSILPPLRTRSASRQQESRPASHETVLPCSVLRFCFLSPADFRKLTGCLVQEIRACEQRIYQDWRRA